MAPKLIDREQKIKDIAQVALALFSLKGFFATSVEQIAESAAIGKGTVYEYFKTKEEIFVYAVTEWIDRRGAELSRAVNEIDDPVLRLHEVINKNMKMFNPESPKNLDENRLYIEVLQQTFMEGGAFYKRHDCIKRLSSQIRNILVNILLDGISRGIFKPEIARDSERYAINFIAYLNGIGQHMMATQEMSGYTLLVELYMKNFLTQIINNKG